jgi:hypothetical protein
MVPRIDCFCWLPVEFGQPTDSWEKSPCDNWNFAFAVSLNHWVGNRQPALENQGTRVARVDKLENTRRSVKAKHEHLFAFLIAE